MSFGINSLLRFFVMLHWSQTEFFMHEVKKKKTVLKFSLELSKLLINTSCYYIEPRFCLIIYFVAASNLNSQAIRRHWL